jgi:hypothetical protein
MELSEHFKIPAESQNYILGNEFEYGVDWWAYINFNL